MAHNHRVYHTRITELLGALDDPTVPRGAVIQLSPLEGPTMIERAEQTGAIP